MTTRCRWLKGRIQSNEARIAALEGIQLKVTWFEEIDTDAGTSGQFTPPANGTILLNQFAVIGVD